MHPSDPFADVPDPAAYVAREASEAAWAELLACVAEPARPAALLAPPGTGKTLLLHRLAALRRPGLRAVYVPHPVLAPAELCAWTLGALGSPRWSDPIVVLGAYLEHLRESGGALLWLVDDAHGLPEETARWLGQVSAQARGALRLVVAAVPDERAQVLDALGPLVRIEALARPLSREETARYVQSRLARADAALRARCSAQLATLHEASGGMPRVVLTLLSQAVAPR